jgi:molybdopterin-containing oxidoreductase family membrane subunit
MGVLVGMWIERFLIVVGTLSLPRLDFTVGSYQPSWVELGILVGSFGLFVLFYLLFIQAAPIVSIWEVREGDHLASQKSTPTDHDALETT